MWLSCYRLTRFVAAFQYGRRGSSHKARPRRRPSLAVEQMEDRMVPATFTPTTFVDGLGIDSLRDAILQADSNQQNNTILLSSGTYVLSATGPAAAATGDLNLSAAGFTETIQGAGAGVT